MKNSIIIIFVGFGIGWTFGNLLGNEVSPIRWAIGFVAIGLGLIFIIINSLNKKKIKPPNRKLKQLRFTTTEPQSMLGIFDEEPAKPLVTLSVRQEFIKGSVKGRCAYIHDEAETLAGYDIPKFIDGDLGQLDLPIEEQDILMVLPSGEYPCVAEYREPNKNKWDDDCYYLVLKK